jgi:hypothetical protein
MTTEELVKVNQIVDDISKNSPQDNTGVFVVAAEFGHAHRIQVVLESLKGVKVTYLEKEAQDVLKEHYLNKRLNDQFLLGA